MGKRLDAYTVIDSTNNEFKININGKPYSVTLQDSPAAGSGYTRGDLAKELENRINEKTSEANHVKVSVMNDGRLKFTTAVVGRGKSVNVDGCTCSFLSNVNVDKKNGYVTTTGLRKDIYPLKLTTATNKFIINIDGIAEEVFLKTSSPYNSLDEIVGDLKTALFKKGVSVSQNGTDLTFTRMNAGSGSVSLDLQNCGAAGKLIFGGHLRAHHGVHRKCRRLRISQRERLNTQ